LTVIAGAAWASPVAAGDETALDHARRAAEAATFSGVIEVAWRDGSTLYRRQLTVEAANGALLFGGPTPLMAIEQARLMRDDAAWDVLWPAALGRLRRPDSTDKYDQRVSVGPEVLGYTTAIIEFRRHDRVRERLFVEEFSGLLLRRQQFDDRGRLQRSMGFQKLVVESEAPTLPRPVSTTSDAPRPIDADELSRPYSAPPVLGEGYHRTGVFRHDDVVHVVYSDGIYDLSVFEQRGRLRGAAVPAGGRSVRIGESNGWQYTWPGGQVLLWQAGRTVYTAVGDAPYDDVVKAVQQVRGTSGTSVLHRLRRASRALVGAFSSD
jgi:sigma-E factor negative regulatory protein RseB